MKKLFLILTMVVMTLTASAQMRIIPKREITQKTYEEAIELLTVMERTRHIERCEYVELNNEHFTTYYGEISLEMEGNHWIRVSIAEFTEMLKDHVSHPSRRIYNLQSIQTELILQTADLYEYLSVRLARNKHIRGMEIAIDNQTGGAYILVYLFGC